MKSISGQAVAAEKNVRKTRHELDCDRRERRRWEEGDRSESWFRRQRLGGGGKPTSATASCREEEEELGPRGKDV